MIDKELREEFKAEAERAKGATQALRDDAWRWCTNLEGRIRALESSTKVLDEKDCPVCGHKTLMRAEGLLSSSYDLYCVPHRFYCYSCGSTFKDVTESKLGKE
jgi:predicted RNA-binding Zn-ribbon protein involved in translation (DUF1610 family)